MAKMAATPIYGKNPSKIYFSRTGRPISTKLGMLYRGLQPIIVCSNDDHWSDLDLFYGKVKFDNLGFSIGKSENSGFSETIAASDQKQMDLMKICEY